MNRERAKELLPIIQAFADGKTVQAYKIDIKEWQDMDCPIFSNGVVYRLKPEPIYRYIPVLKGVTGDLYIGHINATYDGASHQATHPVSIIKIELVEGRFDE